MTYYLFDLPIALGQDILTLNQHYLVARTGSLDTDDARAHIIDVRNIARQPVIAASPTWTSPFVSVDNSGIVLNLFEDKISDSDDKIVTGLIYEQDNQVAVQDLLQLNFTQFPSQVSIELFRPGLPVGLANTLEINTYVGYDQNIVYNCYPISRDEINDSFTYQLDFYRIEGLALIKFHQMILNQLDNDAGSYVTSRPIFVSIHLKVNVVNANLFYVTLGTNRNSYDKEKYELYEFKNGVPELLYLDRGQQHLINKLRADLRWPLALVPDKAEVITSTDYPYTPHHYNFLTKRVTALSPDWEILDDRQDCITHWVQTVNEQREIILYYIPDWNDLNQKRVMNTHINIDSGLDHSHFSFPDAVIYTVFLSAGELLLIVITKEGHIANIRVPIGEAFLGGIQYMPQTRLILIYAKGSEGRYLFKLLLLSPFRQDLIPILPSTVQQKLTDALIGMVQTSPPLPPEIINLSLEQVYASLQ